ncbi:MAG: hypothetical protein ABGY95_05265 [Rubritalea sp.]|uniref:hypothetical protein n=1 Tax=Rubritalea sp. TaxID=2109375 RepID=UPI0032423C23
MSNFRFLSLISLVILAPTLTAEPPGKRSRVNFANGDKVSGTVVNMDADLLEFKSTLFPKNVFFNKPAILDLELDQSQPKIDIDFTQADHMAELQLEGRYGQEEQRDTLRGQLSQIADDHVILSTWYAGELKVQRDLIHSIKIKSNQTDLYSGPNSLEEWQEENSASSWRFENNALISGNSRSVISKDIGLLDQSVLKFQLQWKNTIALTLNLFANSPQKAKLENYYELRMQTNYMYMQKRIKNERPPQLDRAPNSSYDHASNSAEYAIYMDKKKGVFHVFINGDKAHTFTDHAATPKLLGSSIHLRNDNENKMRISNIRLEKWNGAIPSGLEEEEALEQLKGEGQRILLANGDTVVGQIGKINNGMLDVKTEHADLKLPLFGIRDLQLPATEENHPKMQSNDVKAYFKDGGWIILNVKSIDDKFLHGSHEAIGNHAFRIDAFEKIELNIYKLSYAKIRKEQVW